MKKFLLLILIFTSLGFAQTGKSLWLYTPITTVIDSDYVAVQRGSYGAGHWRKMSAANLFGQIRDTTEAYNYGDKDLSNSWNGINDFDGATFNSGSHGKVTFADSVVISTNLYMSGIFPVSYIYSRYIRPFTYGGSVGSREQYYATMYANEFILANAGGDTACIKINGTTGDVEIDKLTITDQIDMSDSATINGIRLSEYHYTIAASSDSVIAIPSMQSSIYLTEGWAVPGIETLTMVGAGDGQVLVITNASSQTVTFEDNATTGGNLDIGSNFACGITDIIALKYLAAKGRWSQLYRSDN